MSAGSVAAVLGSLAFFVLKYSVIWLALYFARYIVVLWIVDPYRSYLRFLPGPPINGRFVDQQLWDLQNPQLTPKLHEEYEKLYGKTIKFQGMAYFDQRLMTVDPVSINYMINRASDIFQKPWQTRRFIGRLVSGGADNQGIFTTEGEMHRKLRRIISPAFSYQSVKNLAPLFFHKSFELRDKLRSVLAVPQEVSRPGIEVEQFPGEPCPRVRMDLHNWIGRATFDIIGLAGFGYEFRSIQEETNTFYNAYRCMFDALRQVENKFHNLGLFFPQWAANLLPDTRTREVKRCRKIIEAETKSMFAKRREEIAAEKSAGATFGKDFVLLNLLLRSNETDGAHLTESEIIAQVDSIMFAGHDTTSMAIQWALWELTRYPPIQARLRAELSSLAPILKDFVPASASESSNTYADLTGELGDLSARIDALPYLEKFVREVLRFHPSVHSTFRVAMKDDVIPVSEPVRNQDGETSKAWIGGHQTGLSAGGIRIRKGEFVHIPIEGMHLLKSVWGEDAHEFNPDRWDNLPAKAKASPGLYANLMSFSVGPNSCPASRWALVEIKIMLAVMIASFEFTGASPMSCHNFLVGRPYEKNRFEKGHRMPLILTPL
ncbi:Cytochrome P450 4F1 OS=Rattus norvegicus GN=Cyp4f1 PE=2 SV=1 [Rhizoctonia solani AG-1 IB]|uniref:Cytochrome P450 4F1 n=1 Tax=Thanatephorus cucumeris (strain AG1-IB / isolate 7/3/14) TaxID=1108050 RepID=A0A0B7FXF4_THACB|nr:Cytochrome P450 4F1 OS=Rattus norvegicus GN=Cyp4f1 PE=2 SV=1 [Rhizoctonia solani AG-1 IB]